MRLAVIDIGSNAIRLQIVQVYESKDVVSFKKLEFLRFPLRLGKDVFKKGKISSKTRIKFLKLMHTFKLLIDLYEVNGYKAVATSAMREASNGEEIRNEVFKNSKLELHIVPGDHEARILNKAIIPYLSNGHYIHIDVGGGSTELNYFVDRELKSSESFQLGSVRKLSLIQKKLVFSQMKNWIQSQVDPNAKNVTGIGTGGNINKLFKLANRTNDHYLFLAELKALKAYVKEFNYKERMSILKMNADRADVIVPASEIYIKILENIKSDHIMVPRVGLKDGITYELFEEISGKSLSQVEFLGEF